jgi:tetratricopeptide (TPR) repeat protein
MALEEIERLKEKINKDPNSKLFVPLAEEYKKAGMFDEAIDALILGLERQPNYLSARVSLGKIYIERGAAEAGRNPSR